MPSSNVRRIINATLMGKNTCACISAPINPNVKTAENDPMQTTVQRVSQELQYPLGGKIQFGISGKPIVVNYLGRREGQAGGSGAPLRNNFY
jgi:hypothetical protein